MLFAVSMTAANKQFTLVIDAGHGGKDAGAQGVMSKEKNINLSVALAFGQLVENNNPDVKVLYTRKTDVFIPLMERANIANRNKADLFISVHTNALPSGKSTSGFETYTLGMHRAKDNLDVAKRENSVILVEKDYKQTYQGFDPNSSESYIMFELMQGQNMERSVELAKMIQSDVCSQADRSDKGVHQAGFLVLRETSMPSCLIELGFITTPDEERSLNDDNTVNRIAHGIYSAFLEYKNKYDNSVVVPYKASQTSQTRIPSIVPDMDDDSSQNVARPSKDEAVLQNKDASEKDSEFSQKSVGRRKQRPRKQKSSHAISDHVGNDKANGVTEPNADPESHKDSQSISQTEPQIVPQIMSPEKSPAVIQNTQQSDKTHTVKIQAEKKKEQQKVQIVQLDEKKSSAPQGVKDSLPVFKIQILASSRKLRPDDAHFKGVTDYDSYEENDMNKYTLGASSSYDDICSLRKTLLDKFPDAFIVAFKNGKKMNLNEAIRELKK